MKPRVVLVEEGQKRAWNAFLAVSSARIHPLPRCGSRPRGETRHDTKALDAAQPPFPGVSKRFISCRSDSLCEDYSDAQPSSPSVVPLNSLWAHWNLHTELNAFTVSLPADAGTRVGGGLRWSVGWFVCFQAEFHLGKAPAATATVWHCDTQIPALWIEA